MGEFLAAAFITGVDAFVVAPLIFVAVLNSGIWSAVWQATDPGRYSLLAI